MATPTFPITGSIVETPDPFQPKSIFLVARNNSKGRIELSTSRDGGSTFSVLIPEVDRNCKAGQVLTLGSNLQAAWTAPSAASSDSTPANSQSAFFYSEMTYFGNLSSGSPSGTNFGYFQAPSDARTYLVGLQAYLQTPGGSTESAPIYVNVINMVTGASLVNRTLTIPQGAHYATRDFGSSFVIMNVGSPWQISFSCPSGTAAQYLTVRLVMKRSMDIVVPGDTLSEEVMISGNNLADLTDVNQARNNLGITDASGNLLLGGEFRFVTGSSSLILEKFNSTTNQWENYWTA